MEGSNRKRTTLSLRIDSEFWDDPVSEPVLKEAIARLVCGQNPEEIVRTDLDPDLYLKARVLSADRIDLWISSSSKSVISDDELSIRISLLRTESRIPERLNLESFADQVAAAAASKIMMFFQSRRKE